MSDLVERLLDDGGSNDRYSKGYYDGHCAAREDAADKISRLTAEVERMRTLIHPVFDEGFVAGRSSRSAHESWRNSASLRALGGEP